MVICRGLDAAAGWCVFYTDRESAKGCVPAARVHGANLNELLTATRAKIQAKARPWAGLGHQPRGAPSARAREAAPAGGAGRQENHE